MKIKNIGINNKNNSKDIKINLASDKVYDKDYLNKYYLDGILSF
jgi:hypothetical protein